MIFVVKYSVSSLWFQSDRDDLRSVCKKGQRIDNFLKIVLGHSSCLICMTHGLTKLWNIILAYKAYLWKLQTCMDWIPFNIIKWLDGLNFCWLFSLLGMKKPRNFLMFLYIRILLNFWCFVNPKGAKPLKMPPAFCSTLHFKVSFWLFYFCETFRILFVSWLFCSPC